MPTLKLSWNKVPEKLDNYLAKDRHGETVTSVSDGIEEKMAERIRTEHEKHNVDVENKAFEIIQSWSPKESKLVSPDKYNEMGQELAQRLAPGHLAWVVTHTDKEHIHNHIVICTVHSETGKLFENKRANFYKMHDINNQIAQERGFGHNDIKGRNPNKIWAPPGAGDMAVRGKKTWFFDMIQRADFAKAVSTSFDEYVGILKTRGVHVRIEDKNISYQYGKTRKAIRGDRIHDQYTQQGLIKAFKENDAKFTANPGLKQQIRGDIDAAFDRNGNFVGTQSNLLPQSAIHSKFGEKDYRQFTKIDRKHSRDELPTIFDRSGGPLYLEMKKASEKSIFEYCKENKVQLIQNKEGKRVLRGQEFVIVEDKYWTNSKNGREGTLIDFVRAHRETSELRAIAIINNNPKLLMLEPHLGQYAKGTLPFYVPKFKSPMEAGSEKTLQRLLSSHNYNPSHAKQMLKNDKVKIGEDLSVWFLGEKNESAFEFKEEPNSKWSKKHHGKKSHSFLETVTKSKELVVHQTVLDFLAAKVSERQSSHQGHTNVFVMFDESSTQRLTEFLALNPHITEVHISPKQSVEKGGFDKKLFNELKSRFNPFDIHVKELQISELGKDRSKGPDISI